VDYRWTLRAGYGISGLFGKINLDLLARLLSENILFKAFCFNFSVFIEKQSFEDTLLTFYFNYLSGLGFLERTI
jgi:hypothetical protein